MRHVFSIVLFIFNFVFRGYLVSVFWTWFVMSQFPTLPHLTPLVCLGLIGLAELVSPNRILKEDAEPAENKYSGLIMQVARTVTLFIAWGMGAILHSFM